MDTKVCYFTEEGLVEDKIENILLDKEIIYFRDTIKYYYYQKPVYINSKDIITVVKNLRVIIFNKNDMEEYIFPCNKYEFWYKYRFVRLLSKERLIKYKDNIKCFENLSRVIDDKIVKETLDIIPWNLVGLSDNRYVTDTTFYYLLEKRKMKYTDKEIIYCISTIRKAKLRIKMLTDDINRRLKKDNWKESFTLSINDIQTKNNEDYPPLYILMEDEITSPFYKLIKRNIIEDIKSVYDIYKKDFENPLDGTV